MQKAGSWIQVPFQPKLGKLSHRGERIVFSGSNTNMDIEFVNLTDYEYLFVSFIMTEYEYEYYSDLEILPNTNINRSTTFD